ncbi:MAG: arginine--tRNA ligase [archaeon]
MFEQEISVMIEKELKKTIKASEISKLIEKPSRSELGDIAFPCFTLASVLKQNPKKIAEDIAEKLGRKMPPGISKISAINGYVNFFVDGPFIAMRIIHEILKEKEDFGSSNLGKHSKIVIDFSGPNIGKPMHIGHIRSTILGDSMLRIMNFQGYDAKGINYLGDIGLHIGKLIVAYELWLDKGALKKNAVEELLRLYIKFCEKEKTDYEEDNEEEFQNNEWTNKAREKLKLLETGDKKTEVIWKEILQGSKKGFGEIYKLLNVNFHETTGQSLFSSKGKRVIAEALKKGLAKIEKDNAVYVELDDLQKKYIIRSNGTASYITQDIGAAVERYRKYNFDRMIYVTDFRQEFHFKQLFAILKKFGYDFPDKLFHLPFGTVNFEGEIMATRKGKMVLLHDVLQKTVEKASEEVKKRGTKGDATDIGVGAVKYAILKNEPRKDINFSWEQALNFEGDSGPYLQYSYARASSILRKASEADKKKKADFSTLSSDKEKMLVKTLALFPEICRNASEQLAPNIIAGYTYNLARSFNDFYESCPVLKSGAEKEARLLLVEASRQVLGNALSLLGINALKEM